MSVQAAEHLDARRYEVRHVTEYAYEADVSASFGRACLRPRTAPGQRVIEHSIEVSPTPDVLDEHVDLFGNFSHYLEIGTPHTRLTVTKRSVVEIAWPQVDLDGLDRWTVADAASALLADRALDPLEHALYRLPSELVDLGPEVRAYADTLAWPQRPLGQAIAAVTHAIFRDFAYVKGATTTRTTLPELLAAREGVCQDFAHLAVGVLRAAGLPARYVSGYIETAPPPGQPRLEGSDATHAWASVQVPGGAWVDLDPTNDQLADSRYLITAWGRDFRDVTPLKGVIFTESPTSRLRVAVDVVRLAD
ncbi:MAG: transglutaminase family protein [Propioniciclava sp.]|uniref:transglutaminase family protein n=1 Tax=Propioniciclava sp. TaxID=2038686 RepID=UPI0039E4130F